MFVKIQEGTRNTQSLKKKKKKKKTTLPEACMLLQLFSQNAL